MRWRSALLGGARWISALLYGQQEISCNAVSFHITWNFTWGTLIVVDGNAVSFHILWNFTWSTLIAVNSGNNGNNSPRCYGLIALRPKQETNNTTNTYFSIE